jgi:HSP20 family molecular chaperone IbpA
MTNETIQNPTVEKESLAPASCRAVTPRYQAAENPDAYVLTVFVPGSATADVETIVEGDRLVAAGPRRRPGLPSIVRSPRPTTVWCSSWIAG